MSAIGWSGEAMPAGMHRGARHGEYVWEKDGAVWEYCPSGTEAWDAYHQAAYSMHRADPVPAADLPPGLPACLHPLAERIVSDAAPGPLPGPDSALFQWVMHRGGEAAVFVVLAEDVYETMFGDGCFRDFSAAFLDEPSARADMRATFPTDTGSELGCRGHLRRAVLRVVGHRLELAASGDEREPFDHWTAPQACDDLCRRLSAPGS